MPITSETIRVSAEVVPFVVNKLYIRLNNESVNVMDVFKLKDISHLEGYDMKPTFGNHSVYCSKVIISGQDSLYKLFETKDKYGLDVEDTSNNATVIVQELFLAVGDKYYSTNDLFVRRMRAKL